MIKAVGSGGPTNKPLVFLGLSRRNTELLLAGKPIVVRLRDLHADLPELDVVLLGGETEDDIAEDLRAMGGRAAT
jgi:hypothetical protein